MRPTGGTTRVHGPRVEFHSPSDSTKAGIQMVYQDLALVEAQDIATNLTIGREILRKGPLGWLGFVDKKAQRRRSQAELDRLGVRTAAMTRPVEMLSGGQRQVVALARSATRVTGDPTACCCSTSRPPPWATSRPGRWRRSSCGWPARASHRTGHAQPAAGLEVASRIVVLNRGRKVADVATARDRQRPARRLDHRGPPLDVRLTAPASI